MIADVIVQSYSIFSSAFSYAIHPALRQQIQPGMLVSVPFRNKYEKAIVVAIKDEEPLPTLKEIRRIIHPSPVLLPYQLEVATWIADYYVCPLCKALDLFLPRYVWEEKGDRWIERQLTISKGEGGKVTGSKEKKIVNMIALSSCSFSDLREAIKGVTLPYLRKLEQKNIVRISSGEIIPPYFKSYQLDTIAIVQESGLKPLTPDQQKVYETIRTKRERVFLLHGITGSGKTEIYLHLAYQNFKRNKQTLVLVPEIALTPQLIGYFFKVFGKNISVLHSQLSEGEKFTEWVRIKNRESFVVIGSRSALFSPFQDLGTIVIDEEHEWTYKNDRSPRYHTRTVARKMADMFRCSLILGSATPDVESYEQARQGLYTLLSLPSKITL